MDEKTIVYIVGGAIIFLFVLYIIKIKYKQTSKIKDNEAQHITNHNTVEAKDLFIGQNRKQELLKEITNDANLIQDNAKKPVNWILSLGYEQDIEELKKQNNTTHQSTPNIKEQITEEQENGFFQSVISANNLQPIRQMDETSSEMFNLLVVDDSFTVRKKLQNLLTKAGYNIVLKNDGFDAVTYLQMNNTLKPDLIITDIEMPKMNGFQFIDWLKQSNQYNNLPIMVISAHVELHLKLMESGTINGFISKPFNDDDLLQQLDYLLTGN